MIYLKKYKKKEMSKSYYKKCLIRKYFLNIKFLVYLRKLEEENLLNDFENNCFYKEEWNYLI
jgi:hypothetical protein